MHRPETASWLVCAEVGTASRAAVPEPAGERTDLRSERLCRPGLTGLSVHTSPLSYALSEMKAIRLELKSDIV